MRRICARSQSRSSHRRTLHAGLSAEVWEVRPELEQIVRERVRTLWDAGISGADLVIACVGAGLRAFTRFARVEYANGEEVPSERFLAEVETVVLETILGRLPVPPCTGGPHARAVGRHPGFPAYPRCAAL